jgi:membrane associated rhomboid family serine protease
LRLWALFFLSAVGGALCYIWINPGSPNPAVGASGAVSGMFAAYLWAALQVGPATAAMRRAIMLTGAGFLVVNVGLAAAARIAGVFPIAWEAHLGGFVAGLILYPVLARR